jgi:hypothetical protein
VVVGAVQPVREICGAQQSGERTRHEHRHLDRTESGVEGVSIGHAGRAREDDKSADGHHERRDQQCDRFVVQSTPSR